MKKNKKKNNLNKKKNKLILKPNKILLNLQNNYNAIKIQKNCNQK